MITKNKDIFGGKPIIAGTRISVDLIKDCIKSGKTIKQISEMYPHLTYDQISEAIQFAFKENV